ncbi:MAG: protein phosphatase 2C domain-containing protein [Tannerellaceae bacterium]|jgi:protein phosphatase|nr:protein phosphatase 2C domain-containing protein [Tannerellaceae bacterium]
MNINLREPQFCYETGHRGNNEDYIYPAPATATEANRLFLVCDGMGGHEDGEVASKTATEAIAAYWAAHGDEPDTEQKVMNAIASAISVMNRLVKKAGKDKGMGTTMTLASISADTVFVTHVGDSRIYQVRPTAGIIYQSKDHSYVQTLVDAGLLTLEEARVHPMNNIITQVIQPKSLKSIQPEVVVIRDIEEGDYLFLCTDGITESISGDTLADILSKDITDGEKMKQIKQICSGNSRDNYSAYLIPLSVQK